jgi:predicted GNAT family N-acyltransferase
MILNCKRTYQLVHAEIKDISQIMAFQSLVIAKMDRKDFFCPLLEQEFIDPIKSNKGVYLIFNHDELIALAVLNTSPDKEIMNEYALEEIKNVALFDSIMVKEEYRGNKITCAILKYVLEEAKKDHITSIIATIHPENIYSLNNFLDAGYYILKTIHIHGGERYIMEKDINNL